MFGQVIEAKSFLENIRMNLIYKKTKNIIVALTALGFVFSVGCSVGEKELVDNRSSSDKLTTAFAETNEGVLSGRAALFDFADIEI